MLEKIGKPNLTDKFTSHRYLETYEQLFLPIKNRVKNVLEIGIWLGGSIQMWHDLFIDSTIYAADITEAPDFLKNNSRIILFEEDAYNKSFISRNFINPLIQFDVMIDDGPHSLESMQFFAAHYGQLLAPGGIMVIEDIPDANWPSQIINHLPNDLKSKARVVDLTHIQPRWDDRLLLIQN